MPPRDQRIASQQLRHTVNAYEKRQGAMLAVRLNGSPGSCLLLGVLHHLWCRQLIKCAVRWLDGQKKEPSRHAACIDNLSARRMRGWVQTLLMTWFSGWR